MSTSCKIIIYSDIEDDEIMLYHHFDGNPSNIMPLLKKAREYKNDKFPDQEWKFWRVGKVASLICWSDPGEFEPTKNKDILTDWNYEIKLTHYIPVWDIRIFKNKKLVLDWTPIYNIWADMYKQMED